jgi:hypothetical protein
MLRLRTFGGFTIEPPKTGLGNGGYGVIVEKDTGTMIYLA